MGRAEENPELVLLRRGRRAHSHHSAHARAAQAAPAQWPPSRRPVVRRPERPGAADGRGHRRRPGPDPAVRGSSAAATTAATRTRSRTTTSRSPTSAPSRRRPARRSSTRWPRAGTSRRRSSTRRSTASRATPRTTLEQAQALSVPGDMSDAQQSLLIALMLRRDALSKVALDIRPALGDEGEAADRAIKAIAGQNQAFNASDVLYNARVKPFITDALKKAEVPGRGRELAVHERDLLGLGQLRRPATRAAALQRHRRWQRRRRQQRRDRPGPACTAPGSTARPTAA